MTSFRTRTIDAPPPVNEVLRLTRHERGEQVADISRRINVSTEYLLALEGGCYQHLPGFVYAKSFLRSYARYLRLPVEGLLQSFQQEYAVCCATTKTPTVVDSQRLVERIGWAKLLATPNMVRTLCIACVALLCVGYLGVKVRGIIQPPVLTVAQPSNNLVTSDIDVVVNGSVDAGAQVTINGQAVVPDQAGVFSEVISLQDGVNTIEVVAQKKHSQVVRVQRNIIVVSN